MKSLKMTRACIYNIIAAVLLLAAPAAGARVVERVYISTDRSVYMAGEDIRCSAFCLDLAPGVLYSELSSLAYLELHSADGLAQTAKIALVHGRGAGVVSLPRTLPTGNYRLIAYTAQNKLEAGYDYTLSARTISVFNPYLKERVKDGVEIVGADEYESRMASAARTDETDGLRITVPARASRRTEVPFTLDWNGRRPASVSVSIHHLDGLRGPEQPGMAQFLRAVSAGAAGATPAVGTPEYEGEIIHARVMGLSREQLESLHGRFAFISAPGIESDVYTAPILPDGELDFYTNNIYGDKDLVCEIEGDDAALLGHMEIESPFVDAAVGEIPALLMGEFLADDLLARSIGSQIEEKFASDTLYQYLPIRENLLFDSEPIHYHLDDYTRFPLMEEVITEFVTELQSRRTGGKRDIRVLLDDAYQSRSSSMGTSLVMLDGVPVFDHEKIAQYDPLLVEDIYIYPHTVFIGSRTFNGVADFVTYKHNLPSLKFNDSVRIVSFKGVSFPTAYTGRDVLSLTDYPDYRQTVYWHPAVDLGAAQSVRLDCVTPDYGGTFEVVVEGIDADGNPLKASARFEVQ